MLPVLATTLATVPGGARPTATTLISVRVQVIQHCNLSFDHDNCRGSSDQPPVTVIRTAGMVTYEF
jgi:hypothetical protein